MDDNSNKPEGTKTRTIKHSEFVNLIADKAQVPKKTTNKILNTMFDMIGDIFATPETETEIRFRNVGTLKCYYMKNPKRCRDFFNGNKSIARPLRTINFYAVRTLRNKVNRPEQYKRSQTVEARRRQVEAVQEGKEKKLYPKNFEELMTMDFDYKKFKKAMARRKLKMQYGYEKHK